MTTTTTCKDDPHPFRLAPVTQHSLVDVVAVSRVPSTHSRQRVGVPVRRVEFRRWGSFGRNG